MNIKVAAFVSSQEEGTYGPWLVNEGLCTLEIHRDLPIDVQARHLFATRLVDDVIIANAYASEKSSTLSKLIGKLTFKIDFQRIFTRQKKRSFTSTRIFVRGDMSEYMAKHHAACYLRCKEKAFRQRIQEI